MKEQERRYPWLSVTLSLLLPGLGQIYAGEVFRGIAVMAGAVTLISRAHRYLITPGFYLDLPVLYAVLFLCLYLFAIVDAYFSARRKNRLLGLVTLSGKDPWLAVFLSIIIPGLGHLYCGKVLAAIVAFVIWVVLNALVSFRFWVFPALPVLTVLIALHAHFAVPGSRERRRGMKLFVVSALVVLMAVAFALMFVVPHAIEALRAKL